MYLFQRSKWHEEIMSVIYYFTLGSRFIFWVRWALADITGDSSSHISEGLETAENE